MKTLIPTIVIQQADRVSVTATRSVFFRVAP
jgi:hypothetical protein